MRKIAIDPAFTPLYTVRMKRKETEQMVKLYLKWYSCGEIAAKYGISKQAVHGRLVRAGVVMRDSHGREKATA